MAKSFVILILLIVFSLPVHAQELNKIDKNYSDPPLTDKQLKALDQVPIKNYSKNDFFKPDGDYYNGDETKSEKILKTKK